MYLRLLVSTCGCISPVCSLLHKKTNKLSPEKQDDKDWENFHTICWKINGTLGDDTYKLTHIFSLLILLVTYIKRRTSSSSRKLNEQGSSLTTIEVRKVMSNRYYVNRSMGKDDLRPYRFGIFLKMDK